MDSKTLAMEMQRKDSDELNSMRSDIFDYLLGLGADPEKILLLSGIVTELAVRDFKQQFKESLGLA